MSNEKLVLIVIMLTQAAKEWLRENFPKLQFKKWFGEAISLIVTIGVVMVAYLQSHTPINLSIILPILIVFALANGGKKLVNLFKSKN